MSDMPRRDFMAAAAGFAAATTAALIGPEAGRSRRPELHEQRPRPAARRRGAADVQVRAGEVARARSIGGSYGKEATVKQLPISKGIAGVSMTARARAPCASCTGTPPRPSGRS